MARKKKPKIVDTIKHKSGISINILLDQATLGFLAHMPDSSIIEHKVASDVKRQVWQWLEKNNTPNWRPIIQVDMLEPFANRGECFVGFTSSRFWFAVTKEGYAVETRWRDPESMENVSWQDSSHFSCDLDDSGFPKNKRKVIFIEYSNEVWLGLQEVERMIMVLKERLNNLIQHEPELLAAAGSRMVMKMLESRNPESDS